ncbi:MAG: hypothetical protein GC204_11960 [Chloroflexi bacterium]|nr:hypothetical protein [Chloroflexota bacterium]
MTNPAPENISPDDLWPEALDALVASANHHELLLEDDRVRVVRTHVPPGERTAVHTHRWSGILQVISWSQFVRRDAEGNVLVDSRLNPALQSPPAVMWAAALPPHTFENVGDVEFNVITVELKD